MKSFRAALFLIALVLVLLLLRQVRLATQQRHLRDCKTNLKNTATALEMYSTDNTGQYPPRLSYLTPLYLKAIPVCPAARKVTFHYEVAMNPDAFTLTCRGGYHRGAVDARR